MKSKNSYIIIFLFFSTVNSLIAQYSDRQQIETIIINSYIRGLIDGEDFEKAKEGIHSGFVILNHSDSLLTRKTRDEWIQQRRKKGPLQRVRYYIVFIDIEGEAASAKINMSRANITAIDYLFLYKFSDEWKIVTAIDHVE